MKTTFHLMGYHCVCILVVKKLSVWRSLIFFLISSICHFWFILKISTRQNCKYFLINFSLIIKIINKQRTCTFIFIRKTQNSPEKRWKSIVIFNLRFNKIHSCLHIRRVINLQIIRANFAHSCPGSIFNILLFPSAIDWWWFWRIKIIFGTDNLLHCFWQMMKTFYLFWTCIDPVPAAPSIC